MFGPLTKSLSGDVAEFLQESSTNLRINCHGGKVWNACEPCAWIPWPSFEVRYSHFLSMFLVAERCVLS
jgi:hypothetical protein